MADSTSNLAQLAPAQLNPDVTANELFDACSPASYGGRNADTSSALTWGYYGGRWGGSPVANGTISLGASTTTYIVAHRTTGAITSSTNTTNWSNTTTYARLYKVVTGASGVTSYEDHRTGPGGVVAASSGGGGGASSPLTTKGDLWGFGTVDARVPVGTNGQQLVADSTQALGVKWASEPFDVMAFYPGVPNSSAKVLRVPLARAVTFAGNFAGSYGKASAASTGTATFDIQKNGSSVGSMVFSASASATFSSTGGAAVSFAAGDVLSIIAPSSSDATLADVGAALAGTR